MFEIRLTYDQLAMIHRSLEIVRTLNVVPPQDELLDDTMQLVDRALVEAVHTGIHAE